MSEFTVVHEGRAERLDVVIAEDGRVVVPDATELLTRHLRVPGETESRARAEAALAAALLRAGRVDAGRAHLGEAARLAPHDVVVRRGLMRLAGEDPFGNAYFALRDELEASGTPICRPLPDTAAEVAR